MSFRNFSPGLVLRRSRVKRGVSVCVFKLFAQTPGSRARLFRCPQSPCCSRRCLAANQSTHELMLLPDIVIPIGSYSTMTTHELPDRDTLPLPFPTLLTYRCSLHGVFPSPTLSCKVCAMPGMLQIRKKKKKTTIFFCSMVLRRV